MKRKTVWTSLSVALACCISGLYLVMYMGHIFNEYDAIYASKPPMKMVIEDTPTIVELSVFPDFVLAEDTYVIEEPVKPLWTGKPLTASSGVRFGPSGKETWYNLPMSKVIQSMRNRGYTEVEYPYSVREDGVKMLGDYVIVAADLNEYDKGDIIETSLGTAIVCDTGDFADTTDVNIDIATEW